MSAIAEQVLENLDRSRATDRYAFAVLLEIDIEINLFKDFLTFEYAEENLLFWREVFEYDGIVRANLPSGETLAQGSKLFRILRKKASQIATTFLENGAPMPVNISGETREKLLDAISHKKDFANRLFDPARNEVEQLMVQGAFPRFNKSKSELIESSWNRITSHISLDEIGKILFINWFMEAPEVIPRFKTNMSQHTKMWVDMFDTAVRLLLDLRNLIPRLIQLGERHVNYANEQDFFKLQKALIVTLNEVSNPPLTNEESKAWSMVFSIMTAVMRMSMKRRNASEGHSFKPELTEEKSQSNSSDQADIQTVDKMGILKLLVFGCDEENKLSLDGLDFHYDETQFNFWRSVINFQKHVELKFPEADNIQEAKEISKQFLEAKDGSVSSILPKIVRVSTIAEVSKIVAMKSRCRKGVFDDVLEIVEVSLSAQPFPTVKAVHVEKVKQLWSSAKTNLTVAQLGKIIFMTFFQNCPDVVSLFRNDIGKHGAMIAGMMNMAVSSIETLESLIPSILEVGSRHFVYNVQLKYFKALGDAAITCFRKTLGAECTPEMEEAWKVVFDLLTHLMYSAICLAQKVHAQSDSGSENVAGNDTPKKKPRLKSRRTSDKGANCIVM